MIIVVVAAILVGFLAVVIAQLLDKPIESYYPHDEQRGRREQKAYRVTPVPTLHFLCDGTGGASASYFSVESVLL